MLAIKLKRIGKKHQPSFRVVINEKRSKATGRYIEDLGWFNPRSKEFKINTERVNYWIKSGAQPTDTVHNLLVRAEAISGPKKAVHSKSKKTPVEQTSTQSVAEETISTGAVNEEVIEEKAVEEKIEEVKEEKTEISAETQEV